MWAKLDSIVKNTTSNIDAETSNPLKMTDNVFHSTVDATIVNGTDYVADVLDPSYKAAKNVLNLLNPKSYKRNGLKNIIKAPAAAITQWLTAGKNLSGGIISGVHTLYKKLLQDNIRHVENATLENIPYVWPFVSKVINFATAVPATIPATLNWLVRLFDEWLDAANNYTLLEWQELAKNRMRV